jgi:hypothetical protein
MSFEAIEQFDFRRAGDLTLCNPETLRTNATKDIQAIIRYIQNEKWESHFITTYYQPFRLKVSGEVAPLSLTKKKFVSITIELIAVRSSAMTELDS